MTGAVIEGWNLMGGTLDWQALPLLAELLGVRDPELWIRGLVQIRDHRRATS